jgi:Tfp pilus assembly protein PilW
LTAQLRTSADGIAATSERHAYGRSFGNYYWGSNGAIVRNVMNLQVAYRMFGDLKYLDASVRQIDHLLGRNVYARSQVTGVGANPPQWPHHRPSIAYGFTFPGLVVGGAQPTARSWVDASGEFTTNEVAINWNAPLVFALAGFTSATDRGIVGLDAGSDAPVVSDGGSADETDDSATLDALAGDVSVGDVSVIEAALRDVSSGDVAAGDVSTSSDAPASTPGVETDAGAAAADDTGAGALPGDASPEVTLPDDALDDGAFDSTATD